MSLNASEVSVEELDLMDPQTYHDNDMARVWSHLRSERPVYWHGRTPERPGFWVVSTYAHCADVYRSSRFSTVRGNMLATLVNGGDSAGGRMVSVTDGPRHKELRRAIFKAFSPRALEYVTDQIRQFTNRLVNEAVAEGRVDFAQRVAAHVPINTVCDLLGVPASDRAHLLSLNKRAVSSDGPVQDDAEARAARNDIFFYLLDLAETRRSAPAEDFVSVLASTMVEGELLSSYDVALNSYSLLLGGDQTSRLSMSSAIHAFATYPDEWRRLQRREVDLDTATEEIIRWATPIMHIGRTASVDVEMAGQVMRAGDIVTLWNSSANRDETVFDRPDRFDVGRGVNKHLAFGLGPHFCVGSHLARTEIKAMLRSLLGAVSRIDMAGPPEVIFSNVVAGFATMPVEFTAT